MNYFLAWTIMLTPWIALLLVINKQEIRAYLRKRKYERVKLKSRGGSGSSDGNIQGYQKGLTTKINKGVGNSPLNQKQIR